MPNDPQVPRELEHLLEKRQESDRRKTVRRANANESAPASDRRSVVRRKKSRRKKSSE